MPPNRALTAVLLFTAGIIFQGCSADSSPSGEGTPAGDIGSISGAKDPGTYGSTGTPAASSSPSGGPAGSSTTTSASGGDPVAACISACETKYPKGVQLGKAIDTCWSKSCPTECDGIGTGASKPAAQGACKNPVSTPSADCSQCTVDSCCTAWDACFDDASCTALNTCSIACYK